MVHKAIPTHLILGFLGVGKTTAILQLLQHKPADEHWAVLVNEFGEIGIDGAILEASGAAVREVPGGCMCCVAGLPMQIGLNMLIQREKPDRLLIEPTGLGHPARIIDTLTGEFYRETLELASTLCLVDPRRLSEPRVVENVHFQDQVAAADVLIANKCDLASAEDLARFRAWAASREPAKARIEETAEGRVHPQWLDVRHEQRPLTAPHAHAHHHGADEGAPPPPPLAEAPWQQRSNHGDGYVSCGWRIAPDRVFRSDMIDGLCHGDDWDRLKGVLNTDRGWRAFNLADGVLKTQALDEARENRLEIISHRALDPVRLDRQLRDALVVETS